MYVLVAEDDAFLVKNYTAYLESQGYDFDVVHNGKDVLTKSAAKKPNIIILDIIMPDMSGFDTLKALKEDAKLKKIPVVMITNLEQISDMEKCSKIGAVDYFVKLEMEIKDLGNIIKKHAK